MVLLLVTDRAQPALRLSFLNAGFQACATKPDTTVLSMLGRQGILPSDSNVLPNTTTRVRVKPDSEGFSEGRHYGLCT